MVNQTSAAGTSRSGRLSEPMALIVSGAVIALLALLVASVGDGNAFAFVAAVVGSIGSTLWLVGVIAMGVQIGRK